MIIVDAVFTFLWLSAFATQASYNTKDSCGNRCSISKAIVGLGVMILYVSLPLPSVKVCVSRGPLG